MPRSGSYPTSYRGGNPGPQWGFLAPVGGVLAWQRSPNPWTPTPMRPFGRPMPAQPLAPPAWDAPSSVPDLRPGRGPLEPAISPGSLTVETAVGRLAPWALAALVLYDMTIPQTGGRNQPRPPSNWTHVCGPFGYPGPPYRNCVNWTWNGSSSVGACIVPLPGQALTINNSYLLPPFGDPAHTLIMAYGPNEALLPTERWYTYDQYSVAAGPVSPLPQHYMLGVAPVAVPHALTPLIAPGVFVQSLPIVAPIGRHNPVYSTRGDLDPTPDPKPKPHPGGVQHIPRIPDTRPRPREREHKSGAAAARGFKLLSQFGSWNSLVHALHRSLPRSCRSGRSYGAMISDLYTHANCLELGAASWELANFWVRYKFAGWAYGRVQNQLLRMDPSGSLLHNLFTYLDQSDTALSGARRRLSRRTRGARDNRKCPGC